MEIGYFPAIPFELGFDAAMHFQPDTFGLEKILPGKSRNVFRRKMNNSSHFDNQIIFNYEAYTQKMMAMSSPIYKRFPSVMPGWDNSPRVKQNAVIFKNSTPEEYGKWLTDVVQKFKPYSAEENFIFINAWNEWAEGNHLEPCQKWGRSYLEATRNALNIHKEN